MQLYYRFQGMKAGGINTLAGAGAAGIAAIVDIVSKMSIIAELCHYGRGQKVAWGIAARKVLEVIPCVKSDVQPE